VKTSPKTTVRPSTPADYPALVAVGKASYPDYGETVEEWRHWDETWDHSKYFKLRVVAEDSGRVVGYGQVNHMRWAFVPTKYRVDITVRPDLRGRGYGTALYDEARLHGWLEAERLVDDAGVQVSALGYPHLPRTEIYRSVDEVYRRFYFRPRKMISLGAEMLRDGAVLRRRLAEGYQFLRFLHKHRLEATPNT